ncbi:MAG TPA: FkbM family methyltransferase [Vicinamibacterales bacterium]|nr:FkbM family methyltransferase [Vicinamibacterales bacterium]
MITDLIYDVGMNNGDDTAYYLHKGYRVVAVEVDPALLAQARDRFASEIRRGQLELVSVAIGPRRETAQFWICEGRSEWNSFDRQNASREGQACHAVEVECVPFRDLLDRYGVPSYLKIDIEGHDHYCVADLDPRDLPTYVSLEIGRSIEPLFTLRELGYRSFKLITQNDHTQLFLDPFSIDEFVKRRLRSHPRLYQLSARCARISRRLMSSSSANGNGTGRPPVNGSEWKFAFGSSGPFGEDTAGEWRTFVNVAYTWLSYQLGQSHYGEPSIRVWHDVHARIDPS